MEKNIIYSIENACCDDGNLLGIEDGCLIKRRMTTGEIIWSAKISAIKPPASSKHEVIPDAEDLHKKLTGRTDADLFYYYKTPFVGKSGILIFRIGRQFPEESFHYHDWLYIDKEEGKLIAQNDGQFVGAANNVCFLILNKNKTLDILSLGEGKKWNERKIDDNTRSDIIGEDFNFGGREIFHTYQNKCLIFRDDDKMRGEYHQKHKCDPCVITAHDYVSIYDPNNSSIKDIKIETHLDSIYNWAMLNEYILRYAMGSRTFAIDSPFSFWIELYDYNGKLISQKEFSDFGKITGMMRIIGTTTKDQVLFYDEKYIYLIDPSSLNILWKFESDISSADKNNQYNFYEQRNSNTIYGAWGNLAMTDIESPIPHQIGIDIISADEHIILWRYTENVLIEKNR